jgi:hypothetical protein
MSATQYQNALICLAILFVVGVAQSASAMETEVALNDDMAIKGGVTPGDAPGYPITITHSGRYRLTSNLYPPGEISGIEIKSGVSPSNSMDLCCQAAQRRILVSSVLGSTM